MIVVLAVAVGYVVVAVGGAIALGRAIRIADERETPQRPVLTVARDRHAA